MKLILLVTMSVLAALAHHGWAAFDPEKTITLQAVVSDFHFINPHTVIEFTANGPDGKAQKWEGELTSSSHLIPLGWRRSTFDAGDKITVTGNPARDGSRVLRVRKILDAQGKPFLAGNAN
jgi:hypothetical protein